MSLFIWTDTQGLAQSIFCMPTAQDGLSVSPEQPWAKCGFFAAAALRPIFCGLLEAIFFPRVILYNFFLILAHLWWFGVLGLGSYIGFLGYGFSFDLMGFGAYGVGPSGFFGFGLSV